MAVPKKRTSVSRKGLRRAGQHHRLYRKFPIGCPSCGELSLPHKVCGFCGTYKNVKYFETANDKKAAKESASEQD